MSTIVALKKAHFDTFFSAALMNMDDTELLATKQDIVLIKNDIEDVRKELKDAKHYILKCMVTVIIAQTALLVGIIAFLK